MTINIEQAKKLCNDILTGIGFKASEVDAITANVMAAELAGKKSHGLSKLLTIAKVAKHKFDATSKYFDYIELDPTISHEIIKESNSSIYADAKYKTGYYVESEVLQMAISKIKDSSICIASVKNLGFATGYIGAYAKMATDLGYIYLGFHNSSGGLIPYGSKQDPWGTNPITIGFPNGDSPVIIDTAMAQITWNQIEHAKTTQSNLPSGTAKDEDGNFTTDPHKAFAVNPIGAHKGSALALGVELLAGALSGSRVGFSQHGGWGATFVLINPEFFVGENQMQSTVANELTALQKLDKAPGFDAINYPGQSSNYALKQNIEHQSIELDDEIYNRLNTLLDQ